MILVMLASFATVVLPAYWLLFRGLKRLADEAITRPRQGPASTPWR